jgi:tyrosine-specific transport protein
MINARSLIPIGLMAGAIIGAGIFSLPFIFAQIGVFNGFVVMALAVAVVVMIHLFYADIIIRTEGRHNFVGFARLYLGEKSAVFSVLITVVQMMLVLVIYLVLSLSFIKLIFGASSLTHLLVFWLLGTVVIFLNLKRLGLLEFIITAGMISIIAVIFLIALPEMFPLKINITIPTVGKALSPIAPIFFALAGRVAVLAIVRSLRKNAAKARKAIILGTIIPAVVYIFFILAIITLSAPVSPDAVSGLIGQLPSNLIILIGVLGLLSLWSSYIIIGYNVNDILKVDMNWPGFFRVAAIAILPLAFYLIGFQDFIKLVSLAGGLFFGLEALFIMAMWIEAKKKKRGKMILGNIPKSVIGLLSVLFILIILNQIYELF